jgi:hypothetical protein
MGTIHVAGYGFVIGAFGQVALYQNLFPRLPHWVALCVLLPPWLIVYTISFCKKPPFGPGPFRRCLIAAMSWYAVATVVAEALWLLLRPQTDGHFSPVVARVLTYLAYLSFVPLIHACIALRELEINGTAEPGAPPDGGPAGRAGDDASGGSASVS